MTFGGLLAGYDRQGYFCELTSPRQSNQQELCSIQAKIDGLPLAEAQHRAREAEDELYDRGITFTVYSERDAIDRILPFDIMPRIITADEWQVLEGGVIQRVDAINEFLHDIYHEQHILKDGIIPAEMVLKNANYRPEMEGFTVPKGTYTHVSGIDIVRDDVGRFLVLEDNVRTPSGVSYVVENRNLTLRAFPDLMSGVHVKPVDLYGVMLQEVMLQVAPEGASDPRVVLLSPGIYNSAYFEHVFLAREMGVPLVEGRDLVVENDKVFMRTTRGLARVHTIYRRLNDDFLDPTVFDPSSMLGVPGLVNAYRKGGVTLANAIGTGVADDKGVYAYMPRIINYYLKQEPILANVETYICREPEALRYTLDNLDKLVVKPVGESGGYGLIIGPTASQAERDEFRVKLLADPANYISQPMVKLSVAPTLTPDGLAPRHLDLRPFAVRGEKTWVLPGGLSRVALREGSMVVNSSQGGGAKDTWVLA